MSILKLSERFVVPTSPDAVWEQLIHPPAVVSCLPGAALEESSDDDRHHKGCITAKLGAFKVSYRGEVDLVELDHEARRLTMKGKGREQTGAGAVSMTMESAVKQVDGGSEVEVVATVQLAGKIVSFGRGMVDAVSREMLDCFFKCLARKLEGGAPETGAGACGDPDAVGADSRTETMAAPSATGAVPSVDRAQALSTEHRDTLGFTLLFRALWTRLRSLFGGR